MNGCRKYECKKKNQKWLEGISEKCKFEESKTHEGEDWPQCVPYFLLTIFRMLICTNIWLGISEYSSSNLINLFPNSWKMSNFSDVVKRMCFTIEFLFELIELFPKWDANENIEKRPIQIILIPTCPMG